MSAVSNRVMPFSMARSITRCDASFGIMPKLLHPRPTTETSRSEVPSFRCCMRCRSRRAHESLGFSARPVLEVPQQGAPLRRNGLGLLDHSVGGAHLAAEPRGQD